MTTHEIVQVCLAQVVFVLFFLGYEPMGLSKEAAASWARERVVIAAFGAVMSLLFWFGYWITG